METFAFYSYKGGSGRSLLLTNAARYLASLGKRVVAIDFDFEAPGLHYKMHIGRPGARTGDVLPERGVVDYLLAATRSDNSSPKLSGYITSVPLPRAMSGKLFLMPAGAAPSGDYWRTLTTLLQQSFFADPQGAGITACLELKARIEDELKPDFILIDSRTGITELAGLVTTLLADKVICLVINNRESLAGARAVMRSFGRAPRLRTQKAIQLLPVLSRVPEANKDTLREVLRFLNEPGPTPAETLNLKHLYVLRVDPELAAEEKLHVGGASINRSPLYQDYLALFDAMVRADREIVAAAARRHEAILQMREWLTEGGGRRYRRSIPESFEEEQIDEGVTLGNHEKRYADSVVYGFEDRTEPLMAAEYADDLKSSNAWQWWEKNTHLRCVILFSRTEERPLERRAFTRGKRGGKFTERDDFAGWIVKWPVSFAALDDPGDRSIDGMLTAVQRGEGAFIGLLVTEWEHSSFVTLHGGAPFRPQRARKIIDGFAQVSDLETELHILWRTAPDPFEPAFERREPEGSSLEEQMIRELHAPLWWRLSAQAKIEFSGSRHRRREHAPSAGIDLLCRDVMGLYLDEDREFRNEVRQLLGDDQTRSDAELAAYRFTWLVKNRELTFELSDQTPPELLRRAALDYALGNPDDLDSVWEHASERGTEALSDERLLSRLVRGSGQNVQTTNLLGAYNPSIRRVTIYTKTIEWSARVLSVDTRALTNIVFLHETVQALCHIGRDLDGRMWNDFGHPPDRDINFRPSVMLETLAQYFSLRLLERLEDSNLMNAFERLNNVQPEEYTVWRRMRHVTIEQMRKVLLRARAGLDDVLSIYGGRQ